MGNQKTHQGGDGTMETAMHPRYGESFTITESQAKVLQWYLQQNQWSWTTQEDKRYGVRLLSISRRPGRKQSGGLHAQPGESEVEAKLGGSPLHSQDSGDSGDDRPPSTTSGGEGEDTDMVQEPHIGYEPAVRGPTAGIPRVDDLIKPIQQLVVDMVRKDGKRRRLKKHEILPLIQKPSKILETVKSTDAESSEKDGTVDKRRWQDRWREEWGVDNKWILSNGQNVRDLSPMDRYGAQCCAGKPRPMPDGESVQIMQAGDPCNKTG